MKIGYSMSLGEILEAEEIEQGDCAKFLVVCPACREALLKKTLPHSAGVTHYLSHYRASDEESRQCEMRVAAMDHARVSAFNAQSRGQTLTRFMAILQTEINRSQERIFPGQNFTAKVNALKVRRTFEDILPILKMGFNFVLDAPDPRGQIASMIGEFEDFSDRSPFWQRRQASHVLDVMLHLRTSQQEPSLRHLLAAAIINIALRMEAYRERAKLQDIAGYDPVPGLRVLEGIVAGKSPDGIAKLRKAILSEKGKAPTKVILEETDMNITRGIMAESVGPIVGLLASIPFAEIANGQRDTNEASRNMMEKMFENMLHAFRQLQKKSQSSPPSGEQTEISPSPTP